MYMTMTHATTINYERYEIYLINHNLKLHINGQSYIWLPKCISTSVKQKIYWFSIYKLLLKIVNKASSVHKTEWRNIFGFIFISEW